MSNIRTIADELKININNKKTRFVKLNNKITFLQINYSFINGKLVKRMKGEKITKFRSKLRKLHKKVLNNEITYSNVENTFKSWMGNFYKLMSRKKRRNLIKLFEDLFDKQITIKSKKMIIQERG